MDKIIKKENNILIVFFIGIIMAVAVLTFSLVKMTEEERKCLEHRRIMELELKGALASVFEMEATQRGYIITRNHLVRETYWQAEKHAFRHLTNIYLFKQGAGREIKDINNLEKLVKTRKNLLDSLISHTKTSSLIVDSVTISLEIKGDSVMDDIRVAIAAMMAEERVLLHSRLVDVKSYSFGSILTAAFLGLVTIIITIYLYRKLYKSTKDKMALIKQSEDAIENLKWNEEKYRNLNDTSNEGIVIADQEGNIISWNNAAENIFGHKEEEIIYQPIAKILPMGFGEQRPGSFAKDFIDRSSIPTGRRLELVGKHKLGREVPIEVTFNQWNTGGLQYYSATIRDITLQKESQAKLNRALEELKRSNEDLEQFAYIASHDLQEPLRKIRAFGDRLKTRQEDDSLRADEYIDRMVDGAERMQGLITDLLSYSRLTSNENNFGEVDLNTIIKTVLDTLAITIQETSAVINAEKLPVLSGANSLQMEQLFQNLLSNALKFKKPGVIPVIYIKSETITGKEINSTNPAKLYYKITVSDNGIGFDPRFAEKIFTVFQRLHGRSEYSGTGIGLAICKKICKNHQGFITAQSTANGADFIVLLPQKIELNRGELLAGNNQ